VTVLRNVLRWSYSAVLVYGMLALALWAIGRAFRTGGINPIQAFEVTVSAVAGGFAVALVRRKGRP
jgi:hypothetical protein